MTQENKGQEFTLKKTDEKINYLTEKIKQNELRKKKLKKVCKILTYTEHYIY